MSPIVKKTFDKWAKSATWYTGHPQDQERFYRFVWVAVRFSRKNISESDVEKYLIELWDGKLDADFLSNEARNYASLYQELRDFAAVRNKGCPVLVDEMGVIIG